MKSKLQARIVYIAEPSLDSLKNIEMHNRNTRLDVARVLIARTNRKDEISYALMRKNSYGISNTY